MEQHCRTQAQRQEGDNRSSYWRSPLLASMVCIIGISLSLLLSHQSTDNTRSNIESHFNARVQQTVHMLQEKIEHYALLMKAGRGVVLNASGQPADTLGNAWHQMFDSFALDYASLGIVGLSYTHYLPAAERTDFLSRQMENDSDLIIFPPPDSTDSSFVVLHLSPRSIESRMRGYDIASGPIRREAALQAMKANTLTVTPPLSLLPTDVSSLDYLLLPVHTTKGDATSFKGWITLGFSMSQLLSSSIEQLGHPLRVQLYDPRQADVQPGFDSHPDPSRTTSPLRKTSFITLGSERIRLDFYSRDSALNDSYVQPFNTGVLIAGLSLTLLLTLTLMSFIITRHRADMISRKMTGRAQELLERYRTLFEQCPEAVVVHVNGRVEVANTHAAELFGCASADALRGRHIRELVHPDSMTFVDQRCAALSRGQILQPAEQKLVRMDGSTFEAEATSTLIHFNGKNAIQVLFRDITPEKQARHEARLVHTLIHNNPDAIMVTNTDGDIEMVNKAFENLTGYSQERILGANASIMNSGRHGRNFFFDLWSALKEKGEWHGDIINRKRNGELYIQTTRISAVKDQQQQNSHYVCIMRDATSALQTEDPAQHSALYTDDLFNIDSIAAN